jgi:hypothetical protein
VPSPAGATGDVPSVDTQGASTTGSSGSGSSSEGSEGSVTLGSYDTATTFGTAEGTMTDSSQGSATLGSEDTASTGGVTSEGPACARARLCEPPAPWVASPHTDISSVTCSITSDYRQGLGVSPCP